MTRGTAEDRTGYIICRAQYNMKIGGPLVQNFKMALADPSTMHWDPMSTGHTSIKPALAGDEVRSNR